MCNVLYYKFPRRPLVTYYVTKPALPTCHVLRDIPSASFAALREKNPRLNSPWFALAGFLEEIALVDRVGIGEHHCGEFLDYAPIDLLAA